MKALITRFAYLLFFLLFANGVCAQRLTIGGYHYPPFMDKDTGSGMYEDLCKELEILTPFKFKWEYYPYARLDKLFEKGVIDLEIGSAPEWTASKKVPGVHSIAFYTLTDIAVFRVGEIIPLKSAEDLKGKHIGMVRGYSFPQFQSAFSDGIARRVDAANEYQLMVMLIKERIDQIFISQDLFRYNLKHTPLFKPLRAGNQVGSYDVGIRVHPNYESIMPQLNDALMVIKSEGRFDKIVQKHLSQ